MSNTLIQEQNLTDLAGGHGAFVTASELGTDAATDAPATSPFCVGVIIGATLTIGC